MLTFENAMLAILATGFLFLFNKAVIIPRREKAKLAWMHMLIDKHYPPDLLRVLTAYLKENGKVNLPMEARSVLNKLYGPGVVHDVVEAVETGNIEVHISGPKGHDFKETSQLLCATFTRGRVINPYLVPAYGSGKTGL